MNHASMPNSRQVRITPAKALVLLSGGLDSMLAVKILQAQGLKVEAVSFSSDFFTAHKAQKAAKQLGVKLHLVDISQELLAVIKKPKYGYGQATNPCIDCHILMLKKAKVIMRAKGFNFVATGEVLGQRPMSQNKQALSLIEKQAGLMGKLLRPLSAQLLPPTLAEKKGLMQRAKLLDLSGRARRGQMALAKKYGLKNYPSPAGGCLLTDKNLAQKMRALLRARPKCTNKDAQLLSWGRHFWQNKNWLVVGRNQEENEQLEKLAQAGDYLLQPKDFPGPTVLIRGSKAAIPQGKGLLLRYAKTGQDTEDKIQVTNV